MADLARIKNNVAKMAAQNAPEQDIDGYIASEGVSLDDVRNFKAGNGEANTTAKTDRLPFGGSVVEDMARSAATGVRQGTERMFGTVGDLGSIADRVVDWAGQKFGNSEQGKQVAKAIMHSGPVGAILSVAPKTSDIHAATTAAIGDNYEPKTTEGKYARTVGEFAPGAVAGPGGIVRKAAMTVIPGVASEAAGQMSEGTEYEPYARLAGALLGGAASAGRAPSAVKVAAEAAPTTQALKTEADQLYGTLRQAGIQYDPNAFAMALHSTTDKLLKAGYRPSVAPQAFGYLDDLAKSIGHSPDFDDINGLVQVIGQEARAAARSPDGAGRAAALNMVRDGLMTFEERAPLTSKVPMPQAQMNQVRAAARQTALQRIKGRTLDGIMQDAEAYSAGQEAGVRNGINNLLRSERGKQMFNAEERKALLEVANGRKGLRTLSRFGLDLRSISGNATLVPTMGATLATMSGGGIPAGAALIGAGTLAKELSPYLTSKAFERASAAVRSGKLRDPTVMDAVKAERLRSNVRRLLAVEAGSNDRKQNDGQ
jgi:hypothetical protein